MLMSMRNDHDWKSKGDEFLDLNSPRRRPSEWWLLAYLAYRLTPKPAGKRQRNGENAATGTSTDISSTDMC